MENTETTAANKSIEARLQEQGYTLTDRSLGNGNRRMILDLNGNDIGYLSPLECVDRLLTRTITVQNVKDACFPDEIERQDDYGVEIEFYEDTQYEWSASILVDIDIEDNSDERGQSLKPRASKVRVQSNDGYFYTLEQEAEEMFIDLIEQCSMEEPIHQWED